MPLSIGWKDLIIPGEETRSGASAPAFTAIVGGIYKPLFHNAQIDEVHATWHMNHDYVIGTDVYMHVHWSPSTTNTGVCRWGFEWSYARGYSLDAFTSTTTTIIEQAASGVAGKHQIAESAALTIPNLETDGLIIFRLFREGNHANDTFTGDSWLLTCDIHYQAAHIATSDRNRESLWNPVS